jgi:hypothetical protein
MYITGEVAVERKSTDIVRAYKLWADSFSFHRLPRPTVLTNITYLPFHSKRSSHPFSDGYHELASTRNSQVYCKVMTGYRKKFRNALKRTMNEVRGRDKTTPASPAHRESAAMLTLRNRAKPRADWSFFATLSRVFPHVMCFLFITRQS